MSLPKQSQTNIPRGSISSRLLKEPLKQEMVQAKPDVQNPVPAQQKELESCKALLEEVESDITDLNLDLGALQLQLQKANFLRYFLKKHIDASGANAAPSKPAAGDQK